MGYSFIYVLALILSQDSISKIDKDVNNQK